jgi:2-C-methyl-D-erythritol 4-phosphate cytidylyltransferase/2-C-methyl-D-erythritol 2,4-cyclodiphosphate synthase
VEGLRASGIARIVVAINAADRDAFDAAVGDLDVEPVAGGESRTDTVRRGLESLATTPPDHVLIHDAARPGVTPDIVARLRHALDLADAAAPALPLADALKRADADGRVEADVGRAGLWRVQTPQAFRYAPLLEAYRALPDGVSLDDDIAVARAAGLRARLVAGDPRLGKITFPEDHDLMERILGVAATPCTGSGFDAHRFGPGDHVTLCGVRIPHDRGLIGHSDADAGWHALTDALLGAIGAGDIGDHFPPTDPRWRGAASEVFLRRAVELALESGGRIVHADITLICERPRIGPHREAMRARTAQVLNLPMHRVSIKATTTERLGFTGREEGLAAQAVATVLVP